MGQVLHGSARTTEAVRRAIQRSEVSVRGLARRHGISPTTVQRWRKRMHATDATMGPKAIHSTVLTCEEEAMVVAFRRHTLLPLDDCLYALHPTTPHLTRSSLHRCLQRHGISRLPALEGAAAPKKRFLLNRAHAQQSGRALIRAGGNQGVTSQLDNFTVCRLLAAEIQIDSASRTMWFPPRVRL
jgi:hypothetical protein